MPPAKTPTSSLPGSHTPYFSSAHLTIITGIVIELLIKRAWYRSSARIRRMRSASASRITLDTRPSSAARLPLEIVEIIIAQLVYDMESLHTCSQTCYSWYIAAVPHLYHTLTSPICYGWENTLFVWSKPLRNMHKLGLLPLVKNLRIRTQRCSFPETFSPIRFNRHILRQFSALTNVQELGIDYLDIPSFMSRIRRYFGHLPPSVRSLTLKAPKGSRRDIVYFIGLFQHLEDLRLIYDLCDVWEDPAYDPTLVPLFAPPLRGRLALTGLAREGILKDMIDLFGGIRFRHMDLYDVNETRLLLGACAKTLETLRLYTTDRRGEDFLWMTCGAS